jgi:ribosome biogenesis GTPase
MLDEILTPLGWDDSWAAALAAHPHTLPARVCRADRDACDVLIPTPGGLVPVTAAWSGALQRAQRADPTAAPVTGDWVVTSVPAPDRVVVDGVLPRRSAVVRAQVDGSSRGQVLAANADIAAVVECLFPDPDPGRIERLLALAWSSGARPVVLLTKADLVPDPQSIADDVALIAPGADVITTSATDGSGLAELRSWLTGGSTIALLGASGVGKSTLLNALTGGDVMRTRALRSDGKGRHTTVTRELHLIPGGGAILDTPGLRTIGLAGADSLDDVFPEVEDLAARCRFADCEHRTEPGCAVRAAIQAGDLPERRLASYRKLVREARHQAARSDARLRAEMTQVWKQRERDYRKTPNKKR